MKMPDIPEGTPLREAMMIYAANGISVGPALLGKNPGSILGKGWPGKTTTDPQVIHTWFDTGSVSPESVFIHCGKSGLIAFDIDHPAWLPAPLNDALATDPPFLETREDGSRRTVLFALGGRRVGNSTGALGSRWGDVRGENGVIFVPPSPHVDSAEGGRYVWKRTGEVPAVPSALFNALAEPAPIEAPAERGRLGTPIPVGCRDDTISRYAWWVSGFELPRAEMGRLVLDRLGDVVKPDDYMDEAWALAKLDSALAKRNLERRRDDQDSLSPLDLRPYLDGSIEPIKPTVGIERNDGIRLLYPGKEHLVIGEMESGKSWVALGCSVEEIKAGKIVLYMHFEEADPSGSIERLRLMGLSDEDIDERFKFMSPSGPTSPVAFAALLDKLRPSLLVLDGVNEAMSMLGQQVKEVEGASAFRRTFAVPAKSRGAAVLSLDHVVKAQDARGRYPLGSVHKANAIDGSLIVLENIEPFGQGRRGRSNVLVSKDRPGILRHYGKTGKGGITMMGTFIVDMIETSLDCGKPVIEFWKPPAHDAVPSLDGAEDDKKVLDAIAELVERNYDTSFNKLRTASKMGGDKLKVVLNRLVQAGRLVETPGARGAHIFTVPEAP